MIVSKKAIPRRTMLRGMGAVLALPLLDSMVPALSALQKTAGKPVNRQAVERRALRASGLSQRLRP